MGVGDYAGRRLRVGFRGPTVRGPGRAAGRERGPQPDGDIL